MNERDREACTQTFFPCSLTVGMLPFMPVETCGFSQKLSMDWGLGAGNLLLECIHGLGINRGFPHLIRNWILPEDHGCWPLHL